VQGYTSQNVARCFDINDNELRKINHPAHRKNKVVSMMDKKELESLISAESRNLITVVTCMNRTGTYIQTLIVFLTTNMKVRLMNAASEGSISVSLPRDWIVTDIMQWNTTAPSSTVSRHQASRENSHKNKKYKQKCAVQTHDISHGRKNICV
jgi:hypothetical protein